MADTDNIRFEIFVETAQALKALKDVQAAAGNTAAVLDSLKNTVANVFKGFNALDFSKSSNYSKNITSLMSGIKTISLATGESIQDVGKVIGQTFNNIPKVAITDAIKGLNNELRGTEGAAHRAVRGLDAVRIALGAIVAMIVFQAIQAIQNFFRSAVQGASDLEMGIYRLAKAERSLSEAGIEISPQGMQEGMEELQKQFNFLSNVDITKLLGNVSLLTKELKLNEDQIIQLSKAIVYLNINSQENEDILQTSQKVITAMITGQARGVAALGLSFSDNALQAKAMEMGILKAGEAVSKLTDAQKAQVKLAITIDTAGLDNAQQAMQDIIDYENTFEGKTNTLKSTWEDFTASLGQFINPILESFTSIANIAIPKIQAITVTIENLVIKWMSYMAGVYAAIVALFSGGGIQGAIQSFVATFQQNMQVLNDMFFPASLAEKVDTVTASVDDLTDSMADLQAAMGEAKFDDLLKDLEEFQQKATSLINDFNTKIARMFQDFNLDRKRDLEDYNRDVQQVHDDFARRRAEAEQKYRNNELDAEAKFQERLRQLRERFLYNLEDALHERDARQVLRLIREYQMEKQGLINEEALRKEAAIREHQAEMDRLRQEEADRLRLMAEEFELKQQRAAEDFAIKLERERQEHEQDMADLKTRIDERLKLFAEKLAEELGLREGGADAIYQLLQKYYGANGFFDQLYNYSAESMAARAQEMLTMLQSIVAQYQQTIAAIGGLGSAPRIVTPGGLGSAPNYPQPLPPSGGGLGSAPRTNSFSAFRPPSLSMGMGGGRGEGAGGQIGIEVILSPDLEARVVENSVNAVADVITKVRRTK